MLIILVLWKSLAWSALCSFSHSIGESWVCLVTHPPSSPPCNHPLNDPKAEALHHTFSSYCDK